MTTAELWKQEREKKTVRYGFFFLLIISCLYAAIGTPILLWADSDITVSQTFFPSLWAAFLDLLLFLFYWGAFSCYFYLSVSYSQKGRKSFFLYYELCVAARYLLTLAISYLILRGELSELGNDLLYLLLDILGDSLQMLLAVLVVHYRLLRRQSATKPEVGFTAKRIFEKGNPQLRALWLMACIPAAMRVLSRIVFDIDQGLPQGIVDLLWMILYYTSDLLCILIGYLVMYWLIERQYLKDEEALLRAHETLQSSDL